MKIKEVEECVGLTRSNIRFYEREGLLSPDRNENNNYRDYTEDDVKRIKKIKILRMLGVSTADIRRLYAEELELEEVMKTCMKKLEEDEKELREMRMICENIILQDMDIHSWDGEVPQSKSNKKIWRYRLEEVFAQDTVNEPVTKEQLNKSIGRMLTWGYLLNAVFTLVLGIVFEGYQGFVGNDAGTYIYSAQHYYVMFMILVCMMIVNVCTVLSYFTDNMKNHIIIFHVSGLMLTPVFIGLAKMYEDFWIVMKRLDVLQADIFSGLDLSIFWLLIMGYVLILSHMSAKSEKIFQSLKKLFVVIAGCTIIDTVIAYVMCGQALIPALAFLITMSYIGINWMTMNMDKKKYNKFDTAVMPIMIMNPLELFIHRL